MKCVVCGGTEYYIDSGFYFCNECQTQNQERREEVLDVKIDLTTRIRKLRIRREKSKEGDQPLGWTSWEQYNFILIGLTNELIELGASVNIRMTVLQLWAYYLKKNEIAFTSTKERTIPKLARNFHKSDAEIIYGKLAVRRKRRRRITGSITSASSVASTSGARSEGSSARDVNKQKKRMIAAEYERYVQSQASSEGDTTSIMNQSLYSVQSSVRSSTRTETTIKFSKAARAESKKVKVLSMKLPRGKRVKYREKHATTQYRKGPQVITPMKLWSIIYLALRIHDENIHLADMLRFAREGHLSYYRLDHLLPPEVVLSQKEIHLLHQTRELTYKGMRQSVTIIAKFLHVWEVKKPNLISLIERYCVELQLPRGIVTFAERMMAMSPPRMRFNVHATSFPNYEARAMAFIVVVMKMLFALDGITEYEISRVIEKINRVEPCVIVHGGIVGEHSLNPVFVEMVEACRTSACLGYQKILRGGNSVDAVEAALWWLENDEFFNCGYGSVVNNEGFVEMDACLMNGTRRECGSVVAIRDLEHPISLARYVMENNPNSIVGPSGAKRLAKIAGLRIVTPESLISPASYFANETRYPPSLKYFDDALDENFGILKTGNLGAVGCTAWDGSSIAAGTSSGGARGKNVGRVGDVPLMGCGIFADENSACCLTGHGESIVKSGLARVIVDDLANEDSTSFGTLKKHLDLMADTTGHEAGGILLRKDGNFGIYRTNETLDPMPFAIVKNHWITCPSQDGEKQMEKYRDPEDEELYNSKSGSMNRLFSFREWQRYIECRRTVLASVHFPTKFKRDPEASGGSHMYLKFLADMRAKGNDREDPVLTSSKIIPRELTDSMRKIFSNLGETTNWIRKDAPIFMPSFTPQYSYLQQLLNEIDRDLPLILRSDFYSMDVEYMTKPKTLRALAARCKIDLKIRDSSVHFFEKIVATFEQPNLPSIQEYNKKVRVEKSIDEKSRRDCCEDPDEYLHRKYPGDLFVDAAKCQLYDDAREASSREKLDSASDLVDLGFEQVLPSGRLVLGVYDDSDDESEALTIREKKSIRDDDDDDARSKIDLLARYNACLSEFEKDSLARPGSVLSGRLGRRKPLQDPTTGRFIPGVPKAKPEKATKFSTRSEDETRPNEGSDKENLNGDDESVEDVESVQNSSYDFGLNDDEISILQEASSNSLGEDETIVRDFPSSSETFFRPYGDYWMLRCNFSRVKHKNFLSVERNLPASFYWLLEECASVVEMPEDNLYEEICLVESYYADVLRPTRPASSKNRYDHEKHRSAASCNIVRKKW